MHLSERSPFGNSTHRMILKGKVAQSCPTLCNPMGYTVHGILQARILEWVTLFPSPEDLPNPGIEPRSPAMQADSLPTEGFMIFWKKQN